MSIPIQYGDTVFIIFPTAVTTPLIVSGVGSSQTNHPVATAGTIDNGDAYTIQDPNSGGIRPIQIGDTIALQRNDGSGYWYSKSGDSNVELVVNPTSSNNWFWQINSINNTTGNVYYGQNYRLLNLWKSQNPTYTTASNGLANGNIQVKGSPNTSNASVISFLQGDVNVLRTNCCRNNQSISPALCGTYSSVCNSGNTGQCDSYLTAYCAANSTTDPLCGCLLPVTPTSNPYAISGKLGPPECIDTRCMAVPNTYKVSGQCNPTCDITVTECSINLTNDDFQNGYIDTFMFQQKCGSLPPGVVPNAPPTTIPGGPGSTPYTPSNNKTKTIIIVIIAAVILLLLIVAIVIGIILSRRHSTK